MSFFRCLGRGTQVNKGQYSSRLVAALPGDQILAAVVVASCHRNCWGKDSFHYGQLIHGPSVRGSINIPGILHAECMDKASLLFLG